MEKTRFIPEKIRLISEKGEQIGVLSREEALSLAEERKLELLLVSKEANPPVFKLGDLGKIKYFEEKKRRKQQKLTKKNEEKIKISTSAHESATERRRNYLFNNKDRI